MAGEKMPSRKPQVNDNKRRSSASNSSDRPQKRTKILLDDSSDGNDSLHSYSGGVSVKHENGRTSGHVFGVNQEFAQRFEHNKKREELQRLEGKYGNRVAGPKYQGRVGEEDDNTNAFTESSTNSEDEDDEGILVSEKLDAEIQATLHAIRAKDPRVYDEKARFYAEFSDEQPDTSTVVKSQSKPMYLSDYHRETLLAGDAGTDLEDKQPPTYAQQQHELRQTVIREMHLALDGHDISSAQRINSQADPEDDDFLVKKLPEIRSDSLVTKAHGSAFKLDPQHADKDPETFLSDFMSARAWVAPAGSKMQPFESDDEEEERRAEAFEEAYNLRFEDPKGSNEKLLSHARDAAARYSVRKEQLNSRKKTRELERAKKEAERQEREDDKKRLRKLRIADAEEKVRKIKDAAGLKGNSLEEQDWTKFIDEAWDDDRWEEEMMKRFGDEYYADHDLESGDDATGNRKRRVKKPKWHDDIEIKDIVPDFEEEQTQKAHFNLTDNESGSELPVTQQDEALGRDSLEPSRPGAKKTLKEDNASKRKDARQQRRRIEEIVDQRLNVEDTLSGFGTKHTGRFRYRDTSPLAYGLTAHDILMATDSQLNQFAGLKKMAAFRDREKKKKDKKMLGKKARLRQWRKETFGNEDGPQKTLAETIGAQALGDVPSNQEGKGVAGAKKSRSRKKGKAGVGSSSRHVIE